MKRPILAPLLAVFAFTSCETAHKAAVSTFRVVDTPASYVRRKLGVDEEKQQTTTTQTSVQSGTAANPPPQPYPIQQTSPPPPPPVQTQRPVITTGQQPPSQPKLQPTATPRVVQRENPPPSNSPVPPTAISQNADLPYAKPVPGKPGYVFSPFDKNGGYVDVTGYSPGQKVKDPYTGKIFLVP
jgi:hypothetical protein